MKKDIIYFGKAVYHKHEKIFGIKTDDRRRHMYMIGKTGVGKTAVLKNMAIQDIEAGRGVGVVDPHGEFAEDLLNFIPKSRVNDVVYIDPSDIDFPIAFNVMEKVDFSWRHLVAAGLLGVFKKIWPDVWSARMEYILNNSIMALLEIPDSTLLGINRLLADKDYREKIVAKVTDPTIKSFWVNEFARYPDRFREEAVSPIQNKVGQFISAPLIRNIIGQVKSKLNMRKVMDEGKILIMNLSKGRIGEDPSKLLGALLITKLQLAAMSRVDTPEEERKDFFLYVDEFQNFATEAFATVLSEARKYRLNLTLAHQYITQMEETVRDAVFGNIGTTICFRVGAGDADFLEKEFIPEFSLSDLVNLPKYKIYLRLMIDGISSRPFSAITLPPFEKPESPYKDKIIKISRERYGTPREKIEEKIARWSGVLETGKIIEKERKDYSREKKEGRLTPMEQITPISLKKISKKKPMNITPKKKPDVKEVRKIIEKALDKEK
ncbi:MAG: type IV secretion system DNA-binding domain-containing protein [Candidatus Pacebacteria bacterium]|nr:type IV secretion system DNA-binding domain-containing protein [Candidatus Paceibacterota bacterium]